MTHMHDEARSTEMSARGGELAVPRVDGAVRDGWARRRATDSLGAQHDVESLVTQLLLEEARVGSIARIRIARHGRVETEHD